MKKLMLALTGFLFMTAVLPAQADTYQEYTPQQMQEKVQKMEVLELGRMPQFFVYTEKLDWYDNQADINVFYAAQRKWKQNPKNFAAVFNYGLVIMSNNYGEGMALDDIQIDEAYRVLEQAKALRPNYMKIYDLQVSLLEFKLFGPVWIGPGLSEHEIVETFRNNPDVARKELALLQVMFKNWPALVGVYEVEQASLICQALNRTELAAQYKAQAQKMIKESEEKHALEMQVREKNKKNLIQSFKNLIRGNK